MKFEYKIDYEIRRRIPIEAQKVIDDLLDHLSPTLENDPKAVARAKKIIINSLTAIVKEYDPIPEIIPLGCLSSRLLIYSDNYDGPGGGEKIASQEMQTVALTIRAYAHFQERGKLTNHHSSFINFI